MHRYQSVARSNTFSISTAIDHANTRNINMDTLMLTEDLSFPIVPGNPVFVEDEDFVVGQWKKSLEEEMDAHDEVDDNSSDRMMMENILEIDRQIGSRFLDADLFGGTSCESPIGPVEELFHLERDDDHQQFLAPFLPVDFMTDDEEDGDSIMEDEEADTVSLSFEERYKATLQKLAFSMKKSQETRKSLTMQTANTEKYDRLGTVKRILSSVATSTDQVQNYVTSIHRQL
jgi:hypothetical protein